MENIAIDDLLYTNNFNSFQRNNKTKKVERETAHNYTRLEEKIKKSLININSENKLENTIKIEKRIELIIDPIFLNQKNMEIVIYSKNHNLKPGNLILFDNFKKNLLGIPINELCNKTKNKKIHKISRIIKGENTLFYDYFTIKIPNSVNIGNLKFDIRGGGKKKFILFVSYTNYNLAHYKIKLPREYKNICGIKLISGEFPNINQKINNEKILNLKWINKDIYALKNINNLSYYRDKEEIFDFNKIKNEKGVLFVKKNLPWLYKNHNKLKYEEKDDFIPENEEVYNKLSKNKLLINTNGKRFKNSKNDIYKNYKINELNLTFNSDPLKICCKEKKDYNIINNKLNTIKFDIKLDNDEYKISQYKCNKYFDERNKCKIIINKNFPKIYIKTPNNIYKKGDKIKIFNSEDIYNIKKTEVNKEHIVKIYPVFKTEVCKINGEFLINEILYSYDDQDNLILGRIINKIKNIIYFEQIISKFKDNFTGKTSNTNCKIKNIEKVENVNNGITIEINSLPIKSNLTGFETTLSIFKESKFMFLLNEKNKIFNELFNITNNNNLTNSYSNYNKININQIKNSYILNNFLRINFIHNINFDTNKKIFIENHLLENNQDQKLNYKLMKIKKILKFSEWLKNQKDKNFKLNGNKIESNNYINKIKKEINNELNYNKKLIYNEFYKNNLKDKIVIEFEIPYNKYEKNLINNNKNLFVNDDIINDNFKKKFLFKKNQSINILNDSKYIKNGNYKVLCNLWNDNNYNLSIELDKYYGRTILIDHKFAKEIIDINLNKNIYFKTLSYSLDIPYIEEKKESIVVKNKTNLNISVRKNNKIIEVKNALNFEINNLIIIGNNLTKEVNIIKKINKNRIFLKNNLKYNHKNDEVIEVKFKIIYNNTPINVKDNFINIQENKNIKENDLIIINWNGNNNNEELNRIKEIKKNKIILETKMKHKFEINTPIVIIPNKLLSTQNFLINNEWYTKIFYEGPTALLNTNCNFFNKYNIEKVFISGMKGFKYPTNSLLGTENNYNYKFVEPIKDGFYYTVPFIKEDKYDYFLSSFNILKKNYIIIKGKYIGYGGKIEDRINWKNNVINNNGFSFKTINNNTIELDINKSICNFNFNNNNLGKNGIIYQKKIKKLEKKNNLKYFYLTCPKINLIENANNQKIKNIFAKIINNNNDYDILYNTFISDSKKLPKLIKFLDELEFKFLDEKNNLINFNDINHSFTIQIEELIE